MWIPSTRNRVPIRSEELLFRVGAFIAATTGTGLLVLAMNTDNKVLQSTVNLLGVGSMVTALGLGAAANHASSDRRDTETAIGQGTKDANYKNTLTELLHKAKEAIVEDAPALELFDWNELKEVDLHPLIFVAGVQGSGKTTVAQWLGATVGSGTRIAISPHLKPDDFQGFNAHIGGGSNYWEPPTEDYDEKGKVIASWYDDVPLTRILENPTKYSIHAALISVQKEVEDRLKLYARGVTEFTPIDIYLDESIAISRFFSNRCSDNKIKGFFGSWLIFMMTEPRKVRVRVFVLTQATTVSALGCDGMSALKDEYTFVRLGKFALKHYEGLAKRKAINPAAVLYVAGNKAGWKPCMVNDYPAVLPATYADLAKAFMTADTSLNKGLKVPDKVPDGTFGSGLRENHGSQGSDSGNSEVPDSLTTEAQDPGYIVLAESSEDPAISDMGKKLWIHAQQQLKAGMSKTAVIKSSWGYQGRSYQNGVKLWEKLAEKYGNLVPDDT